ncbi:MAG: ferritin family protein [Desulfobacterales bacterium]|jgi:rubrerythrin
MIEYSKALLKKMISRRQLLYFSALLSFCYPIANLKCFVVAGDKENDSRYPFTINILKQAYWAEMIASKHYDGYCQRALSENYPNIAYLFFALSISEKIHAHNYQKLIVTLNSSLEKKQIPVSIDDTKENLSVAAIKELEKIKEFYPEILNKLSLESYDQAIINCMYSWKSHQQHEEIINDIKRYSGLFFRLLSKKIEGMNPDYYVCEICGSTVNEKPVTPCEICNYPLSRYKKIKRPVLF